MIPSCNSATGCCCLPTCMPTYAINTSCISEPPASDYASGVVPLDTLAAQWWNWMWRQITLNEGKISIQLNNIWSELANVLSAAGLEPDSTDTQLLAAIRNVIKVSTGDLTTLDTTDKSSLVNAINEVHDVIGDLSTLSTSVQTDIVSAINSFIALGGVANGYATLDSTGRIPYSQLPESAVEYCGSWNASTNTPTLENGIGTNGTMYIVSTGGIWNGVTFNAGDRIIYSGNTCTWDRISGGSVLSVNGCTGAVCLCASQIPVCACYAVKSPYVTNLQAMLTVCSAGTVIGGLSTLCTLNKCTIVCAINSIYSSAFLCSSGILGEMWTRGILITENTIRMGYRAVGADPGISIGSHIIDGCGGNILIARNSCLRDVELCTCNSIIINPDIACISSTLCLPSDVTYIHAKPINHYQYSFMCNSDAGYILTNNPISRIGNIIHTMIKACATTADIPECAMVSILGTLILGSHSIRGIMCQYTQQGNSVHNICYLGGYTPDNSQVTFVYADVLNPQLISCCMYHATVRRSVITRGHWMCLDLYVHTCN